MDLRGNSVDVFYDYGLISDQVAIIAPVQFLKEPSVVTEFFETLACYNSEWLFRVAQV